MKSNTGLKSKIGIIIPSIVAVVIFTFLTVSFINNSNVKTVIVPSRTIQAGETISANDLKEIEVSSNIQGITSESDIVGLQAPKTLSADQILYMSNFQSSIFSADIPANFIVTTINIPRDQAVGGAIASGDHVDISGVAPCSSINSFSSLAANSASAPAATSGGIANETNCVYYILANVEVLQVSDVVNNTSATTGTLGNAISSDTSDISLAVALSYADMKKIREAEGALNIWANLSPQQNSIKAPLLNQMNGQASDTLHNADDGGVNMKGQAIKDFTDNNNKPTPAPTATPTP